LEIGGTFPLKVGLGQYFFLNPPKESFYTSLEVFLLPFERPIQLGREFSYPLQKKVYNFQKKVYNFQKKVLFFQKKVLFFQKKLYNFQKKLYIFSKESFIFSKESFIFSKESLYFFKRNFIQNVYKRKFCKTLKTQNIIS
jgi:hypothetical protein